MKTSYGINGNEKVFPRTFTFNQLSRISDDNYGVLNQCIDLSRFNTADVFILEPVMIHNHFFGQPVKPHLRTLVSTANGLKDIALQDLTFDQWRQGIIAQDLDQLFSNQLN